MSQGTDGSERRKGSLLNNLAYYHEVFRSIFIISFGIAIPVFGFVFGWNSIVDSHGIVLVPMFLLMVFLILLGIWIYPDEEYRWYKYGRE